MAPRCLWTETIRSCPRKRASAWWFRTLSASPWRSFLWWRWWRSVRRSAAPVREAKQDLCEVVEEGSTTAPTAELPLEPKDLELLDPNEPAVSQNRAQDLLLSGKEVWAATLALADVVALWSQNRGLPRILVQEQEEIYVSAQFLQAHCKKLSLEGSPRSQRERSRSPRRCKQAAEEEQAEAAQPAEDVEMPDAKPEEAEPAAVAEPESALPDADAKPAEEAEDKPADAQPADAKPSRALWARSAANGWTSIWTTRLFMMMPASAWSPALCLAGSWTAR